MNNKTFEHLYTVCESTTRYITELTLDTGICFTPHWTLKLYGIPSDWSMEQQEIAIEDKDQGVYLGEITGFMILGEGMERYGYDMYDLCDALMGDLEFVVSALREGGGPLSEEIGGDTSNVFYIDEITLESDAVKKLSKSEHTVLFTDLIQHLPDMLFTHTCVFPTLLIYYPKALPHEKSRIEKLKEDIAMMAYAETMKDVEDRMFGAVDENEVPNETTPRLVLSEEQLNIVMGRRNAGASYPLEYIDVKAWKPYMDAGFMEWRNTRTLFKYTEEWE